VEYGWCIGEHGGSMQSPWYGYFGCSGDTELVAAQWAKERIILVRKTLAWLKVGEIS